MLGRAVADQLASALSGTFSPARKDRDGRHPEDDAGEMTGRLLRSAGITVTGVTVTELGPGVTAMRIELGTPGGTGR
jgi:hypothetical protein